MEAVVAFSCAGFVALCFTVSIWRHHKKYKLIEARFEAERIEFEALCAAAEAVWSLVIVWGVVGVGTLAATVWSVLPDFSDEICAERMHMALICSEGGRTYLHDRTTDRCYVTVCSRGSVLAPTTCHVKCDYVEIGFDTE